MLRPLVLLFAVAIAAAPAPPAAAQQPRRTPPARRRPPPVTAPRIPTPRSVLGFEPGDDRKLADWPTLVRYYQVLAYRLASDTSLATRAILDNVILWLVPSLNPDGVSIVTRWYNRTLGTTAEGTDPPELYHHYAGHDNNRDWYAFTQVETQLVVDSIHNVWHPQIVHDIHQQDTDGSRLCLPPYLDPIEPNVDPLLVDGVNALGTAMAWALAGQGKTGIVINAVYDAWTPARAYQHYHGGVRILSEAASANLASPIDLPA